MDPYAILGIEPGATRAEIRAAYRAQAIRWHPDRHQGASTEDESTRRMQMINVAYAQLSGVAGAKSKATFTRANARPADPPTIQHAYELLRLGRVAEAERALLRLTESYRNAFWWRCYAACRMRAGDIKGASAAFASAAALDTSDHFSRGMASVRRVGVPLWRRALRALTRRTT